MGTPPVRRAGRVKKKKIRVKAKICVARESARDTLSLPLVAMPPGRSQQPSSQSRERNMPDNQARHE